MAATYEKGQLYQLSMAKLIPDPEQPRGNTGNSG